MWQKLKKNYGWLIVAYGALSLMIVQYLSYNAFSLFVVPITEDLQISRSTLSFITTISSIVGMVIAPISGRLFSRKSVKKLMLIGLSVTSASLALQYFARSVYLLYFLSGVRDCGVEFCMMMPLSILVNRWFEKNRDFAFSIMAVGISLGGVIFSVPLSNLIGAVGWRKSYLICGLIALGLLVPLCLLIVKDYPPDKRGSDEVRKDEAAIKASNKVYSAKLHKDPAFWLLGIGMLANSFCCVGLYHISAFSESLGTGAQFAALMLSVHSVGAIISKLLMGTLFDRFGLRSGIWLGSGGASLAFGLMVLAAVSGSRVLLVASILCYGLSFGSQSLYSPSIISRTFGFEHYSLVAGEAAVFTLLGSAISNPVVSGSFDLTQSYTVSWIICLGMGLLGLVCLLSLVKRQKAWGRA